MSLQELKDQVRILPVSERLELVSIIIDSLKELVSRIFRHSFETVVLGMVTLYDQEKKS